VEKPSGTRWEILAKVEMAYNEGEARKVGLRPLFSYICNRKLSFVQEIIVHPVKCKAVHMGSNDSKYKS
jgi:hypothetical protein